MNSALAARNNAPVSESRSCLARADIDNIAVLTLNRVQARNSLSAELLAELQGQLGQIGAQTHIRAVVLAAEGPAFSAGHDLKELTAHRADADGSLGFTRRLIESCTAVMLAIMRLPQPVIAAVEGIATAAGCQLVATCDLAVASTTARFCTPGVHIGLFCSTPMVALSRNIARKHAMEMLLTGDTIGAHEAFRIALVNRVVEPGEAREEALALARKMAAKSAAVIKLGKEAFYRQMEMGVTDAYRYAGEVMLKNMLANDAAEGISAFLEKRPPSWHHL